jgi:hypothetical protein
MVKEEISKLTLWQLLVTMSVLSKSTATELNTTFDNETLRLNTVVCIFLEKRPRDNMIQLGCERESV